MNQSLRTIAAFAAVALGILAGGAAAHDGKLTFAPVLAKVTPAVVNIEVGMRVRTDPRLRQFFRDLPRFRQRQGGGAGVIIDADAGHVVTNHHVIDNAHDIRVTLEDGREFEAELVGSDPATDIALLKIDGEDLRELPLGDSDKLAVGDFVVAIGNPYDLGHTVTSGIVSALGRQGFTSSYQDFIQTDAAINRGNSGGPLVDLDGRLVGINSAITSPTGVSGGLGFAVPSNTVKFITDQLADTGAVRRGLLGVHIDDVPAKDAELLGLKSARGVVVEQVMPDTAADAAGIEAGDVIVSLNEREIASTRDLMARVANTPAGTEVEIGIVRDGKRRNLDAVIGSQDDSPSVPRRATLRTLSGAEVRDLPSDHELHGSGVEVVAVAPGSRADGAGFETGDIILGVNRKPVGSVAELEEALADADSVWLTLQRGDRRSFRRFH